MLKEIHIKKQAEKIIDGTHYKGYLEIADTTTFDYELKFTIPIDKLHGTKPASIEETRSTMQIKIKKDGTDIELTNKEYEFFFRLLAEFVIVFYYSTRDNSGGMMGRIAQGVESLASLGASISICPVSEGIYQFPPELCEMLNAPKFDCKIK